MNIIIVGCGKVGFSLARSLSAEKGVDVTIVDSRTYPLERASETIDAMLFKGDGLNAGVLIEAGAKTADLIICVTDADERNILCCTLAEHLGVKHSIARVRNPEYSFDGNRCWRDMGVDMIINPEQETAREISRLLRFPSVDDIEVFVDGRVELVSLRISDSDDALIGKSISQIFRKKNMNILFAVIERSNAVIVPNGDVIFEKGDVIKILGRPSDIMSFLTFMGRNTKKTKNAVIIGGGRIAHYLLELLHRHWGGTSIKVIELSREKCEDLSVKFPRCVVINGDGTDEEILSSECVDKAGAVICLTDRDEENAVIALYSMQLGIRKVVAKINHINPNMVKNLGLGSIVSTKNVTSDRIIQYVNKLSNIKGDIKTIHKIIETEDDKVEAVELYLDKKSRCINKPIKDIKTKRGVLIGCIVRNFEIIIPSGETTMKLGDRIVIIAKNKNIRELDDILTN